MLAFGALALEEAVSPKEALAVDECGTAAAGTTRFSAYSSGTTYRIGMLVRMGTNIHRKTSTGTGAPGAAAQNGWSAPLTAGTGYAQNEVVCDASDTPTSTPAYDNTIEYTGATAVIYERGSAIRSESLRMETTTAPELYLRANAEIAWVRNVRGQHFTLTADLRAASGAVPITVITEEGSSITMDLTDPTGGSRATANLLAQGPVALYVNGGFADDDSPGGPDIYLDLAGSISASVSPLERTTGVFATTKSSGSIHVNLLGSITAEIFGMTLAAKDGDVQLEFYPTASISVGESFSTLTDADGFWSSGINARTYGTGNLNLNLRGGTIDAVGAQSAGINAEIAYDSLGDININVRDTQISVDRGAVTTNIDPTSLRNGNNAILARGLGRGAVNIIVSGNARLTNSDADGMGGGGSNVYAVSSTNPGATLATDFRLAPIDICIGEKNADGDCIRGTSMPVLTTTGAGMSNVRYSAIRDGDVRVDVMTGRFETSGAGSHNVRGFSGRVSTDTAIEGGKGNVNINIDGASLTTMGDGSSNVQAFSLQNGDDGDIAVNVRDAQLVTQGASFNINMLARNTGGSGGGGNLDLTLQRGAMLMSATSSIAMTTLDMNKRAMVTVMEGAMISASLRSITIVTQAASPNMVVNMGTIRGGMAFRGGTNTVTNMGSIEGWFCSNDMLSNADPQCHVSATPFGMEGMKNAGRVAFTNMDGASFTITRPMTLGADTTITAMSGSVLAFSGASMMVGGMEMRTAGRLNLGANPDSLDLQGGATLRVLGIEMDAQGNPMPVIDADTAVTLPAASAPNLMLDLTNAPGSILEFTLFSDSAMGADDAEREAFMENLMMRTTVTGGAFNPDTGQLNIIHSDEASLRTYDALFQSAWHSDRALSRQMMTAECQTREGLPQSFCSWVRIGGRFTRHDNTNSLDYGEDTTSFLAGGHMTLPLLDAFFGIGYERGDFDIQSGSSSEPQFPSDADRFLFAFGAKGQGSGMFKDYDWDAQLRAGYTDYDVARRTHAGGIIYRGKPNLVNFSLAAGIARTFQVNSGFFASIGNWNVTPRTEIGFMQIEADQFTETSSAIPLAVASTNQTLGYVSVAANAVHQLRSYDGVLKTELQVGIDAFINDPETDWSATASTLNLSTKGTMEQAFLDLGLTFGFQPRGMITGLSLEFGYDGNFSPSGDTQVHRASAKFIYAF